MEYCRAQGADLVSVHSHEEAEAISNFVIEGDIFSYTYFWIGLNNIDDDAGYVWTDSTLFFVIFKSQKSFAVIYKVIHFSNSLQCRHYFYKRKNQAEITHKVPFL